jgi:hypothetical protein
MLSKTPIAETINNIDAIIIAKKAIFPPALYENINTSTFIDFALPVQKRNLLECSDSDNLNNDFIGLISVALAICLF